VVLLGVPKEIIKISIEALGAQDIDPLDSDPGADLIGLS
jgi:hypothetical protein